MPRPDPVYLPLRGREVRGRPDDERLRPYTPIAAVLRSAAILATGVDGLRRVLQPTVGAHYRVEVPDHGSEVRLRRRGLRRGPPLAGRASWSYLMSPFVWLPCQAQEARITPPPVPRT